ncbi:GGDEF domain-containing protein [Aquimonas voraii]|uniref:diguanylate cyclase n=1 Tax=Aquimonas voraii TaxID=265719 RepID=A0A1G6UEU2_9GAMM|nr:GGDEF domain-containing protein [Aquimonas voraii]SDD39095.1 diguanylate cyclase (GGDEF) domain-containing protein [Aquimonas voraii]
MDAYYHLQSLSLAPVVLGLFSLACLTPALLRPASEFGGSQRAWLLGTALVVASDLLFFIGWETQALTAVFTVLAGLGIAEWLHALRLYRGETRRLRWPYVLIGAAGLGLLQVEAHPLGVLMTSSLFAALYLGGAWQALKIPELPHPVGRWLLVAVLSLLAVVALLRLGLLFSSLRSGAPAGFTSTPRAWLFVLSSIGPVLGSFAFVLACGERLGHRLLTSSLSDGLTGVPNRRAFVDAVHRALAGARRHHTPLALLMLDIDHFKRINDAAGHAAGDRVLVEVCRRLHAALRPEDSLARLGGEEFGVLLPGCEGEAAREVAERIRRRIAEAPVLIEGEHYPISVSIGVVSSLAGEGTPELLMEAADRFLSAAKAQGRDRVVDTLADDTVASPFPAAADLATG